MEITELGEHFGFEPSGVPPVELGVTLPVDALLDRSDSAALLVRSVVIFKSLMCASVELFRAPGLANDGWLNLVRCVQTTRSQPSTLTASMEHDGEPDLPLHRWSGGSDTKQLRAFFWGAWDSKLMPEALKADWSGLLGGRIPLPAEVFATALRRSTAIW